MEYVIMLPMLILQIIILPLSTGWIMAIWTDNRTQNELQDAANHIGSTIQQLYLSLNRKDVLPSNITQAAKVPTTIESYPYYATGALRTANASKILNLHFVLQGKQITANSSVTMGPNVLWDISSTFMSNSSAACIRVWKQTNGAFVFSFS
jgi:hypothetical protein